MAILVGVTGGICSGKSTVLEELKLLGHKILKSDDIVHRLYEPGTEVHTAITRRWGAAVTHHDGSVNKAAVARQVFASHSDLQWLNQLIHPRVRRQIREESKQQTGPLFCEVPLLFEVGWETDMHAIVAVWCKPHIQRERAARRGWTPQQLQQREARQLTPDQKLERSDFGIINNENDDHGKRPLLQTQLVKMLEHIRKSL